MLNILSENPNLVREYIVYGWALDIVYVIFPMDYTLVKKKNLFSSF